MQEVHDVVPVDRFDANAVGDPSSPAASWRRGFGIADVASGTPYLRPAAVSDLLDQLDGSHVAVTGGPAAGKSTLSLLAACRWREADRGPVYHARRSPQHADATRARIRDETDDDQRPLVVVENALADDGRAAAALVAAFEHTEVTVLLELRRRDVGVVADASGAVDRPLRRHVGDELTLFRVPSVDLDAFESAVAHYETATGTTVSSSVPTLYDALRADASQGNVLMHFAHWVGNPSETESALDRAVEEAYDAVTTADDDLVLDAAVVAVVLAAADLPLYPTFFYGLDAPNEAIDDALDELVDVVVFYTPDGPLFDSHHCLWATRFLETLAERDARATERFANAIHAILELLDRDVRESARSWFVDHSTHAPHFAIDDTRDDGSDASSTVDGSDAVRDAGENGLLTSDARRRPVAVGTTGQVVERLLGVGTNHPALASLYGTCDDDRLDLSAYCSPTTCVRAVLERGEMHFDSGDYDRADAEFQRAHDRLERADGIPRKVAERLVVDYHVCRGRVATRRSDFEAAHDHYRAAYDVARDLGDRTSRARSHLHLGVADLKRGRLPAATAHLEASRVLFRDRGEQQFLAGVLQRLGIVYWQRGRLDDAERALRNGLDRFARAGDRVGVAKCRNNLGIVAQERDDYDDAEPLFERSLRTSRDVGYRPGELKSLLNLGSLAVDRDDLDAATTHFEQCRSLARTLDDSEEAATALNNLGVVALERESYDEAADAYRKSLAIHRDIGDRSGEGRALNNLGEVDRERGRLDDAVRRLRESLAIRRDVGTRVGEARSHHELGRCLAAREEYGDARQHLESAVEHFEAFDAQRKQAAALRDLGCVARDRGDTERALDLFQRSYDRHDDVDARRAVAADLRALQEREGAD